MRILTRLLVALMVLNLLAPASAHALFGVADVGIFDIPAMQLDALDFIDNVVMRILIVGLLLFAESQILVLLAASILEWAIDLQVPLGSSLVTSGWAFMVGILNLVLVLIVIVIAFSAILRLDTFQMRKTLPRLVAVALLVNFSPLFVGIFVDIAQVFMNTIKDSLGSFVSLSLAPLKSAWAGPFVAAVTAAGLWIAAALIPIGNVASAVATGALFLGDLTLGTGFFLKGVILTVFNFATGIIFLLFAFLFVARTVVLAMLAIVAPLALAAAILPGTQKYWDRWISALMSWSLLGIVSLFLMGLGMKVFSITVTPLGNSIKGLDVGFLDTIYIYVFLLVYLVIAFGVSRKLTAMGAEAILTQAKNLGGKVGKVGGGLLKEGFQKDLVRAQALKEKQAAGGNLRFGEKLSVKTSGVGRWAYRGIFKTSPEAAVERDMDERVKEFEKRFGKDVAGAAATFGKKMMSAADKAALGLYLAKTKGLEGLDKLGVTNTERLEKQRDIIRATAAYNPKKLEDIVKHEASLIEDSEVGSIIVSKMVTKGMGDADAQKLHDLKPTATNAEILRDTTYKKALDAMTPADLENADKAIMDNPRFREAIVRFKPSSFILKIAQEWGADMIDRLQETAEQEITGATIGERLSSIAETNPSFLRMPYTPGGAMFTRDWQNDVTGRNHNKNTINDLIKTAAAGARARRTATPGAGGPTGGTTPPGAGPAGGTTPPPGGGTPPPPGTGTTGGFTGGTGPTPP